MKVAFTQKHINYLVNEIQALALRTKLNKRLIPQGQKPRELTIGLIIDMINALPKPKLKTPLHKRLWRWLNGKP